MKSQEFNIPCRNTINTIPFADGSSTGKVRSPRAKLTPVYDQTGLFAYVQEDLLPDIINTTSNDS